MHSKISEDEYWCVNKGILAIEKGYYLNCFRGIWISLSLIPKSKTELSVLILERINYPENSFKLTNFI